MKNKTEKRLNLYHKKIYDTKGTKMTREKQIEKLAVKVMGWVIYRKGIQSRHGFWDPFTNIDHSFQVAEKIGGYLVQKTPVKNRYFAYVDFDGRTESDGETPQEAISLAALKWLDAKKKRPISNRRDQTLECRL